MTTTSLPRMTRFGRAETSFGYVVNNGPSCYSAFTRLGTLIGRYSRKADAFAGKMNEIAEYREILAKELMQNDADVITVQRINEWDDAEILDWANLLTA